MRLERDSLAVQQAGIGATGWAPITAMYRRGLLRAKVNVERLSRTHALIECPENPRADAVVWLTFSGIQSRAAVVEESASFRLRLRFIEPFHPAVLDALRAGKLCPLH